MGHLQCKDSCSCLRIQVGMVQLALVLVYNNVLRTLEIAAPVIHSSEINDNHSDSEECWHWAKHVLTV